ncbi:hypothetical protein TCAL_08192 [Tigriopus californicus]|uniref:C2 domain-containing protein n=1 Tax=Tigriopus californicus TaxID=6832 RepID=A0A553NBM3_TIGCA|nr:extended synaptotagmin-2-B-like [Tigriopus californicus]XP_059094596.1 extended synaptotagmin-2-B-like [Tigriopus californicus]XP_059094597.1 extended synaptotagmin-2-B-like [Tigriopus californicus]TRY62841.1 hypothetical protein TCAL_08192 [Tigriopus californicus]
METPRNSLPLPMPIIEIIRRSEAAFASQWFNDLSPLLAKLLEWTLMFGIGYWGFGYGWILFFATVHFIKFRHAKEGLSDTICAKLSTLTSEKEVIGSSLEHFPSWVSFPDFDRVEWINDILAQLWKSIDGYATYFIVQYIEPEIRKILDSMALETVSGFKVQKIALGDVPARVGGIKVYNRNVTRDEIILDAEVIYNGDARVLFTLQGIKAEIRQINFRGTARITLKPIVNTFPFIGGFEIYFLNKPVLDYNLGGIGTFAEVPGANAIVKSVVEDQIRSRFVWPNRFRMFLPMDVITSRPNKSFLLSKPAGVLQVNLKEAKDLLKKDKGLTGSGLSDPYAVMSIGERKISFRNKYVPKTVNPEWNYIHEFIMEDSFGQKLMIDVFDFDNSTTDDFLGSIAIEIGNIVESQVYDEWMRLSQVKHGQLHLNAKWLKTEPITEDNANSFQSYVVSILIDSCKDLSKEGKNSLPSPRCKLTPSRGDPKMTQAKTKTKDPIFEESFLFFCHNASTDSILIKVVDSRGSDSLGQVRLPIDHLKNSPRGEYFDMNWDLDGGLNSSASIIISAKLFGVEVL